MSRIRLHDLLETVLDADRWSPLDLAPVPAQAAKPGDGRGRDPEYVADLRVAAERSGSDESVLVGTASVNGQPVIVVASDFDFLAGSIGADSADRICAGFDLATERGLPVIGFPTSGGTRMQEGTPTFVLMAAIAGAVRRHAEAGLPYLTYLRNPTTGGVFATWGSLGDYVVGEPGALTGFLGPRVYEGLYGEPFPPGVQTSEGLANAGVLDAAMDPADFRQRAGDFLQIWALRGRTERAFEEPGGPSVPAGPDGWACIQATRRKDRYGVQDLLSHAGRVVRLSGDGAGNRANATVLALAELDGVACVLVAQDRAAQLDGRLIGPGDLKVAGRGMRLADRLGLPLVTVVDTQGGELSANAERGGLAGQIARCLSDLSALRVPTVSLMLGGGGGGVALALLPTDRVVALEDAWLTPLPAEGASLIRYRTTERADEMARSQRITAADLASAGVVDRVLPIGGGGSEDPAGLLRHVAAQVRAADDVQDREAVRAERWRAIR